MSYKHNNLMAMREKYWSDNASHHVQNEKTFFCETLQEHKIFDRPSLDDARYFFFTLPSIVIVKGYALGFTHDLVKSMIAKHIEANKVQLKQRHQIKIQYAM
ncbi:hypothetical protein [Acinetobacter soli]|uniref:hypothetical protein n=1 Tax=Acinetobacter soli TaxID=487316 RepID=UPI000B4D3CA6|nr:hypothetical protein [Acinetobacter soli]